MCRKKLQVGRLGAKHTCNCPPSPNAAIRAWKSDVGRGGAQMHAAVIMKRYLLL